MTRADPPTLEATGLPGERLAFLGVVLWVALMGAERVDLLGGQAGFSLTPFLALTPVLLVLEGLRVGLFRLRVRPPDRRAMGYGMVLACLVCVALVSTFGAVDADMSAKRSVNLVAISVGTLVVALAFGSRPWTRRALAAGAEAGIVLALLFTVGEVASFFRGGWTPHLGPVTVNLEPLYAGLPRFSGQVGDANRAGLLVLLYVFFIVRGRSPGLRRRIGVAVGTVLILLTLSRSAVLAGLAAGIVAFATSRAARVSRPLVLAAALATAALALVLVARPRSREVAATLLHPVTSRFTYQGSAQEHAYLISRGLDEATSSIRNAAIGIGYGDSFTTLQDVFPGNKYGNFHSLYVSMFAESGVLALLFIVVLLGYPFLRPGPYLPMFAALWIFDVFYQASSDPSFWLVLALAWLTSAAAGAVEPEAAR